MRTFFNVEVAARAMLSPAMLRLTFAGEELRDFVSTGIGDEYLRLFFPDPATGERVLPIIDAEGRWRYDDDKPPVRCATYTVRRFDPARRSLDIDLVLHEGGTACGWARDARPGDAMVLNRPRGLYAPPEDFRWQLLMADATGIPALARLLEQTPQDIRSRVVIEVAEAAHRQPLPAHPGAVVSWIEGAGNGVAPSALEAAFRALKLPETPGYVWVAAEQEAARAIRQQAKRTRRLPPERCKIVAYWVEAPRRAPPAAGLSPALQAALAEGWAG
ncbi:siderophore-interacting protein [Roseomonas sp. 18066]|uniref:siderophore-interacting protein n=1 Tax=Roseomonas sp. 18066 TaxID=2681412 RepID=UPI001356A3FF|nr:siderophore-interacting protein [Roseomonas sp. 18066]